MSDRIQNLHLIEGVFSPLEAADVLFSLINDKIKFHHVQMLGIQNDETNQTDYSKERIKALENNRKIVKNLILKARDEGFELKINGDIQIQLISIDNT